MELAIVIIICTVLVLVALLVPLARPTKTSERARHRAVLMYVLHRLRGRE